MHFSVDNKSSSKTGVIIGVVIGVAVCLLAALAGVFVWRQKRRKLLLELEGTPWYSRIILFTLL